MKPASKLEPISATEFETSEAHRVPSLQQVADDTWVLGLPMPPGHMPYTLGYAIRDADGGVHLVDPGWDTDENWSLLSSALSQLGRSIHDVTSITATHLHPDHVGLAPRIREESGATIALHQLELIGGPTGIADRLDGWGIPPTARLELDRAALDSRALMATGFDADLHLRDGDVLDIPGRSIVVLHTPGHTSGHICLVDADAGLLFTGDHLLPTISPGIGLGGTAIDPIDDYLTSLRRILEFDAFQALPGHTWRFTGIAQRSAEIASHHLARTREVEAELAANPSASIWQIAERLTWTAGWAGLREIYLASALAQTALHVEFLRSGRAAAQFEAWATTFSS